MTSRHVVFDQDEGDIFSSISCNFEERIISLKKKTF